MINKILKFIRKRRSEKLLSLSSTIIGKDNGFYVRRIIDATSLFNFKDNNIAIEGDYCVGKSSIIKQICSFVRHPIWNFMNRPKSVSFLSFDMNEENEKDNKDKEEISKVLQKEIVKQLFYGEKPNVSKRSGYKRVGKSYWLASAMTTNLILFLIVAFYVGGDGLIYGILNFRLDYSVVFSWLFLEYVVVSIILIALTNLIFTVLSSNIKSLKLKDFSAEMVDKEPDFDQMLDQIIYYFHMTHRRVVFFEDLDRLNNQLIFEQIRQLNIVLNSSRRFRKIKFVYAVKGKIFGLDGNNKEETASIRTKMFDVIIDVIPFLSKMNAQSVFEKEYERSGIKGYDVIKISALVGRHITDMRVMRDFLNKLKTYEMLFKMTSDADYNNCVALSLIWVFEPDEFKKLSTGDSALDTVRADCMAKREKERRAIEEKYTLYGKIKMYEEKIWDDLRARTRFNNKRPYRITVDEKELPEKDGSTILAMYKGNISKIMWDQFGGTVTYGSDEIKKVVDPIIDGVRDEQKNKELSEISNNKNIFSYYTGSLSSNVNDNSVLKNNPLIHDLITSGFLNDGYVRFVSRSSLKDDSKEGEAHLYISNYIRGDMRREGYYIDDDTLMVILEEIDDTDLSSTGMYNFSLFDYFMSNYDVYEEKFGKIIESAGANIDSFLDFFIDYCVSGNNRLASIDSFDYDYIDKYGKEAPQLLLAKIAAKAYPEQLLNRIAKAKFGNSDVGELLYAVAVLSLDSPGDVVLDVSAKNLLENCASLVVGNGGERKLLELCIRNKMKIIDLNDFGISNDEIEGRIEEMSIELNRENIHFLSGDAIIRYINKVKISDYEVQLIIEYADDAVKEYMVRNVNQIINVDDDGRLYDRLAAYSLTKKIVLKEEELLQYADRIKTDQFVDMINLTDFTDEDKFKVALTATRDQQLVKIANGGRMKLKNDKRYRKLASKILELDLAKKWNTKKRDKIVLDVKR